MVDKKLPKVLLITSALLMSNPLINEACSSLIPDIDPQTFEVHVALDLRVDLDMNVNIASNFQDNDLSLNPFSSLALIMQSGEYNEAFQRQYGIRDIAIIYQEGTLNVASQYQGGDNNFALVYQKGNGNTAIQHQESSGNIAIIYQLGIGNYAEQYQARSGGYGSVIIQEGNFNRAIVRQY